MYHSITFGNKNTYDDWHLVSTSRPVIAPPKPKMQYVDIPGADGSIDLTESLAGRPVFSDREGSLEFYVLNDLDGVENYNWSTVYEEITAYLHGQFMRMILEDDPENFYEGRFSINSWKTNEDRSTITIDYRLGPYKYNIHSTKSQLEVGDIFVLDGTVDDTSDTHLNYARTTTAVKFKNGDGIGIDGYRLNVFLYDYDDVTRYISGIHSDMTLSVGSKWTFGSDTAAKFSFAKLDYSPMTQSDLAAIYEATRIYKGGKT